jgi:hypothetical protein
LIIARFEVETSAIRALFRPRNCFDKLEEARVGRPERYPEVFVDQARDNASRRRALEKVNLQQIRFIHTFDVIDFFTEQAQ